MIASSTSDAISSISHNEESFRSMNIPHKSSPHRSRKGSLPPPFLSQQKREINFGSHFSPGILTTL